MLKIRLQRNGRRNQAHFRVVVAEHTIGPKSHKFVEILGSYDPKTKDTILKDDRIKHWISVGAQPTDRVHNMLVKAGIIKADTINVLPQKSPVVSESDAEEVADTPADGAEEATEQSDEATDDAEQQEDSADEGDSADKADEDKSE